MSGYSLLCPVHTDAALILSSLHDRQTDGQTDGETDRSFSPAVPPPAAVSTL